MNRLFVLAFENDTQRTSAKGYYLPNVDFFDQPVKNNKVTYENIRKTATCQGFDYTTDCLLDYPSFKDSYTMIAVDLNKQQTLDKNKK